MPGPFFVAPSLPSGLWSKDTSLERTSQTHRIPFPRFNIYHPFSLARVNTTVPSPSLTVYFLHKIYHRVFLSVSSLEYKLQEGRAIVYLVHSGIPSI